MVDVQGAQVADDAAWGVVPIADSWCQSSFTADI